MGAGTDEVSGIQGIYWRKGDRRPCVGHSAVITICVTSRVIAIQIVICCVEPSGQYRRSVPWKDKEIHLSQLSASAPITTARHCLPPRRSANNCVFE